VSKYSFIPSLTETLVCLLVGFILLAGYLHTQNKELRAQTGILCTAEGAEVYFAGVDACKAMYDAGLIEYRDDLKQFAFKVKPEDMVQLLKLDVEHN
jgi:hypothetical protein